MIVVDTDIIIWLLRGDKTTEEQFKSAVIDFNGDIFVTPIQVTEIYAGLRPNERLKADHFIESLNVINIDKSIGKLAGEFIRKYGKSYNVTIADALIAACTITNGFKLWTLNKKHYPMLAQIGFFLPA